jgi:hypothetical protein
MEKAGRAAGRGLAVDRDVVRINAQAIHDIAHALQACTPPGGDPCASTCVPKPIAEVVAKAKACEWAARDLARLRELWRGDPDTLGHGDNAEKARVLLAGRPSGKGRG